MKAFLQALALVAGVAIGIAISTWLTMAYSDEFGSFCVDKNGLERCTIWQWDSSAQKMIKKEIIRTSTRSTHK